MDIEHFPLLAFSQVHICICDDQRGRNKEVETDQQSERLKEDRERRVWGSI